MGQCLAFIGCHRKLKFSGLRFGIKPTVLNDILTSKVLSKCLLSQSTSSEIGKLAQRCKARFQISQYHDESSKLLESSNRL